MDTLSAVDIDYELAHGELVDVLPILNELPDVIESEEKFWDLNADFKLGFSRLSRFSPDSPRSAFAVKYGGICDIFPVQDKERRRVVVVKRLRPDLDQYPDYQRLFRTEVETLKKLRGHPRWVQILGTVSETEMVLELVIGIPLSVVLQDLQEMSLQKRIYLVALIGRDVSEALASLHDLGQVHADVSPSNILLCKQGVKMIDLNIALQRRRSRRITFGKIQYLSPEAARGGVQDIASDYYSLGVVLYKIIVGHPPCFRSRDDSYYLDDFLLLQRVQDNDLSIGLLPDATPVSQIIKALLAAKMDDRPDAATLAELLKPFSGAARTHVWTPDESSLPQIGAIQRSVQENLWQRFKQWLSGSQ